MGARLQKSIILLSIIILSAIVLSIFSYNYFTQSSTKIQKLAVRELETNSEIESFSISNGLESALYTINSNLDLIASSPSTMDWNISRIQTLLEKGLDSTANITDGYYLVDKSGGLVTFTGIHNKNNSRYIGTDLSDREYFKVPKQNGSSYISTVIVSNDNIPRMYISVPIFSESHSLMKDYENRTNIGESFENLKNFEGVVFASIEIKMLGKYLESQIHPNFPGDLTFVDRNGTILYTHNQTLIGEKVFGSEFQGSVQLNLKEKAGEFNSIIRNAMDSESGINEFVFDNDSTTIAYNAVLVTGKNRDISPDRIGTLFITAPHTLAQDVASLINIHTLVTFATISSIVVISVIIAALLLKWNRVLGSIVDQKTNELKSSVSELKQSNDELTETRDALASTNKELAVSNSRLKVANNELRQHDVMQKEFINIAAHELRTPSQAISGNLELIEMSYIHSLLDRSSSRYEKIEKEIEDLTRDKIHLHEFVESLLSTYRNSQRLEKIVNDILDVSRIEGNRLELHKELVNINEEVRNVIKDLYLGTNDLSNPLNSRKINIRFEPEQDPMMVFVDRPRIFQTMSNLLNNAIKFSNNGPIIVSVTYITRSLGNNPVNPSSLTSEDKSDIGFEKKIVVSIRDQGKGIDHDILPKMFTKFSTKSISGTGLGLFIAKNIIESHDGKIWAQNNEDGKGATFSFSLPMPGNSD